MTQYIFITNGTGGCGKDTFANFVGEFVSTKKISSVDFVKKIANDCGWDGRKKTEQDRKFLSDLKCLLSEYNDLPFRKVKEQVLNFWAQNRYQVLFIDIREPIEIERAKRLFNAQTILIENNRVDRIITNEADANVYNYNYDFIIENNGTLEELREKAYKFVKENIVS